MNEGQCQECGASVPPDATFCKSCGARLQRSGVDQHPSAMESPSHDIPTYASGVLPRYQGVAVRFVGALVDSVILAVVFWALSFVGIATITIDATTGQTSVDPLFGVIILVDLIIAFLYFTLLEGRYGQTIGKMALKMKVVRKADHSPIGYAEAAVRTILRIIDLIPFFAPYLVGAILIWSSDEKQRLGDRVAHTVVIQG